MTFSGSFADKDSDMASLGVVIYSCIILVISLMTLLHTYEWSKSFLASLVAGNFILYAVYVFVYEHMMRKMSGMEYALSATAMSTARFWLVVALISCASWVPVLAIRTASLVGLRSESLKDKMNALRRKNRKLSTKQTS